MLDYSQTRNHKVHQTIRNISASRDAITPDGSVQITYKRKIGSHLKFIQNNIEKSDVEFLPQKLLDDLDSILSSAYSDLEAFHQTSDDSSLENALAHVGRAIGRLPVPLLTRHVSLSNRHIQAFREKGEALIEELLERASGAEGVLSDMGERVSKVDASVEALEDRSAQVIDGLNTSFSESQSQRTNQFQEWLNAQEGRVDKFVANSSDKQKEMEGRFGQINSNFEEKIEEIQGRFDQVEKDMREKLNTEINLFKKKSNVAKQEISEMHEEIRLLYKLTGDDALVGGYQGQANEESKSADRYRLAAICLMIAAALVMVFPYFLFLENGSGENFSWSSFLERLPFSTVLLIPALYAARESGKHRKIEREFRAVQLQISTLDPFISKLPDAKQKAIKEELVAKYFAGPPADDDAARGSRGTLQSILDELRELIGRNSTSD